ncbi:MAG TPA: histidine kinase [Candidatus Acidoferrales bacterium]|nr:histidine kinase [Candidatus Acidoferrales bacterium]
MAHISPNAPLVTKHLFAPNARSYYIGQAVGWATYAALLYALSPEHGTATTIATAIWCVAGMIATHALRVYVDRHPWHAISELALTFVIAVAVIPAVMTLVQVVLLTILRSHHVSAAGIAAHFLQGILVIALWCAIYLGAQELRRRRAAEIEALRLALIAQTAQFQALRAQLQPHFLFNYLNSLRELMNEDHERAERALLELSGLLRYTLRADQLETVTLKDELGAVESYLSLEKIRFEKRLRLRYDVDPSSLTAKIPPMLLQTLAENGLKHGIAKLPAGGDISISAVLKNGILRIRVANSGSLRCANVSNAVGLKNARERLRLVYGDRASLDLRASGENEVLAEVTIPRSDGEGS